MRIDSSNYKDWLLKAENDLKSAEAIMGYYEDPPTDTACYHCHQAAEKSLKGYLVYQESRLPWVHDLIELLNLCLGDNAEFEVLREDVEILNKYYIEAKYPADIPILFPKEEAGRAIERARMVMKTIKSKIRDEEGL